MSGSDVCRIGFALSLNKRVPYARHKRRERNCLLELLAGSILSNQTAGWEREVSACKRFKARAFEDASDVNRVVGTFFYACVARYESSCGFSKAFVL